MLFKSSKYHYAENKFKKGQQTILFCFLPVLVQIGNMQGCYVSL